MVKYCFPSLRMVLMKTHHEGSLNSLLRRHLVVLGTSTVQSYNHHLLHLELGTVLKIFFRI